MTKTQFDKEIARLLRRVSLLRSARSGDVKLRRTVVKGHYVRRHWVEEHERFISPRKKVSRS